MSFILSIFHTSHCAGSQLGALYKLSKYSVTELHLQPFFLLSDLDLSNFGRQNTISLHSWRGGGFLRSGPTSVCVADFYLYCSWEEI